MEFTREQLEYLVKLGPIDRAMKVVRPTLDYGQEDWFAYRASELAGEILRERTRAERAELKIHDVEEDFDTLVEELTRLRNRLATAEAERDILQWASDHSGGKNENTTPLGWRDRVAGLGLGVNAHTRGEWVDDPARRSNPAGDRDGVGGRWVGDREWEEDCSCAHGELLTTEPSRPHEALVWAILFAANAARTGHINNSQEADEMLSRWRARWPEPEA